MNATVLASISIICEKHGGGIQVNKFEQVSKGDPCVVMSNASLPMVTPCQQTAS